MKHGVITLAPQKKEIIIILLICLRYDERHKAEDWLRCCRNCPSQGRIHTPSTICSKMCTYRSLPLLSCWCISTVLTCLQIWINHVKSINFLVQPSQNVSYSDTDPTKHPVQRKQRSLDTKQNMCPQKCCIKWIWNLFKYFKNKHF